jgi:hypothetical protein
MKRKLPFIITIIATVVIGLTVISCIQAMKAKHPYTLNDQYAGINLSGRKIILVLPGDSNIVINNKRDVFNCYGGQNVSPASRIKKYYFPLFFQTLKSFISSDSAFLLDDYRPGLLWDTTSGKDIVLKSELDSGESASHYRIPEKASMQAAGMDSAVVITVQRLEFKRNNLYVEYYWDDKTRKPANLEADVKVLIWDYAADAPVFYGSITQKIEFTFGMNRKHWDESAQNLAKKIVTLAKCL